MKTDGGTYMWNFYYDEAFHDRNITVKDGSINIYRDNGSDIYIGFFHGYEDKKESEIWEKYVCFEKKYKAIFTVDEDKELKGTIIKKKNYRFGFSSFLDNTICFYNDFFDILDDEQIIFQICMISKTELIVKEFMHNVAFKINFNKEPFLYSIIKFLYNYRDQKLLIHMMQVKNLKDVYIVLEELKYLIKTVIQKSGTSKKKRAERKALEQVLFILEFAYVPVFRIPQLSWRYEPIFIGFNKLLAERGIAQKDVSLYIDNEKRTYEAAKIKGKYYRCLSCESTEYIGIRISDILAHFFGEIADALELELEEGEIKQKSDLDNFQYVSKRMLSPEWFNVSEQQFLLWRKIENIFYRYQFYEWTGYDGTFCDYPILTFALLEYNLLYKTYDDFKKVSLELHADYFNTYCCNKLNEIYIRGGSSVAE